ncbi:MAG: YjbQ family protein [Desulfamplus sp.]|jgi:secondary thiamine-phosphate synthase enzyme|nr:YjbQ family protein [Desulfamplus sp.]
MIINIQTSHRTDMVDITDKIERAVKETGITTGIVHVYSMHTTAAITINENADHDVKTDISNTLDKLIPWEDNYRHTEGNSAAHLKTSLIGTSELVPIANGKLIMGTWQGVFLCEFDGPRHRKVHLTFLKS